MVQNNVMHVGPSVRGRGRPKSFDPEAALDSAMQVFWADGYEGASIGKLCRTMGMPRASLYEAYAGKEELFLAAVEHYVKTRLGPAVSALERKGSLREDLAAFFDEILQLATSGESSQGCLISCALSDAAGGNPRFRKELDRRYAALEEKIAVRIRKERLSSLRKIPAELLAVTIASFARGLMLRARAGTGIETLRKSATTALSLLIPK